MKLFSFIVSLVFIITIRASHIVGGEIYYDYLGSNQYKISIALYRDCHSNGAAYDSPLSLGVFVNGNNLYLNELIDFTGSTNVPITFNNPCVTPPHDICIEKTIYTTVLTLPPRSGGYTLAYQRCCRGPNVLNLVNPTNTGLTLATHIPGSDTGLQFNSSPRFSGYPPTILCSGEALNFDHSATDPDGDQLIYSLIAPNSGGTSAAPAPNPPNAPPYTSVSWLNGYSNNSPLGNNSTISINSSGLITTTPNNLGLYVVGIRVQEYRNGSLVGETIRDFLFNVINCNIPLDADIPPQTQMSYFTSYCQGLTFTFDNNSYGATNYLWDFGVLNSSTDVSTQYKPTFTFPAEGTYVVTLIANPGWTCTDTIQQTFIVNNSLDVRFVSDKDSICVINNSFNFSGTIFGQSTATYVWDFGPNASISSSSNLNVNNVSFNTTGFIPISLNAKLGTVCSKNYKDSIYIFPFPTAQFTPPPNYLCEGLTTTLTNQSLNATNYQWDFGVQNSTTDVSSSFQPTFTFPQPGNYTIQLISKSEGLCIDTTYQTLVMNEKLDVWFTNNDSLCITDNSFNFDGSMVGASTTTYTWDFGQNASIQNANTLDVNNVVFSKAGTFPITLTANYANCVDQQKSSIFIYKEPIINFSIEDGLMCNPFNAKFINLSTADAPLQFKWDFGDGGTSNFSTPSYIYDSVGKYNVVLTSWATKGCVDTITTIKDSFIIVHPNPIADFMVDKSIVDICHSEIQFFDQSIGAKFVNYQFGADAYSTSKNVTYTYPIAGSFYPIQIAINEYFCRDTIRKQIFVEPFNVFIPNSFTPDGDANNNVLKVETYFPAEEWDFTIYNRWGDIVFYTTDQYAVWDGMYQGKKVQIGLYNYILKYASCDTSKNRTEVRGHINLLK